MYFYIFRITKPSNGEYVNSLSYMMRQKAAVLAGIFTDVFSSTLISTELSMSDSSAREVSNANNGQFWYPPKVRLNKFDASVSL